MLRVITLTLINFIYFQSGAGQSPPPAPPSCGDVLNGYSPDMTPFYNPPGPVVVNITLTLMDIYSLDFNILTAAWDSLLVWNDPRLQLPCDEIILPSQKVWTPDAIIYNGMTSDGIPHLFDPRFRVWVERDGTVFWQVFGDVKTRCQQDLTLFPFDRHDCTIVLSTEAYCSSTVNFTAAMPCVQIAPSFPIGSLWTVDTLGQNMEGGVHYTEDQCSPVLTFRVRLSRQPIVMVVIVAIPVIILLIINVATFCLPPTSGEKISLAMSVFFILVLFFAYGSNTLPIWSSTVPLIVIYVVMAMVFSALSVLASVFVIHIAYNSNDLPPPTWLLNLSRCFGAVMCVQHGDEVGGCQCCGSNSKKNRRNDAANYDPRSDFKQVIYIAPDGSQVVGPVRANGGVIGSNDLRTLAEEAEEEKSERMITAQWNYVAKVADRVFFMLFIIAEIVVILVFLWWYPAVPVNGRFNN